MGLDIVTTNIHSIHIILVDRQIRPSNLHSWSFLSCGSDSWIPHPPQSWIEWDVCRRRPGM